MPVSPHEAHHLRFAIFHDRNPGHLWRGELGSMLGEAVLAAGIVMWLALLTYSPANVAYALIAMGLPALIAGPLGATLTRVEEPARLFTLFGRVRVAFALALIGMHYLTILPVLYLLLFGISLCGRLRSALRVAAMRACLAPGEPERVAASTHFAAVVVAVVGPLLATLLYILNGERILLLSIGTATLFLLSTSADALVKALPPQYRAFLLARPEQANDDDRPDVDEELAPDVADGDELGESAAGMETLAARREAELPEWEQWGPGTVAEAVADIRAGLRLTGGTNTSSTALRALAVLALVGGGVSVFEVFYITDHLFQPTFYLGALLAAEGAGLAVGATLWSDLGRSGKGKAAIVIGILATGLALALLAGVKTVPLALAAAMGMGAANALAVEGAREALRAGFDGVERRALAAAESLVVAVCGIAGAAIFVLFHHGYVYTQHSAKGAGKPLTLLVPYTASQLILAGGVGLVLAGIVLAVLMPMGSFMDRERARHEAQRAAKGRSSSRGRVPPGWQGPDTDDVDDLDASGAFPAANGGWDDDTDDGGYDGYDQRWGDEPDEYQDSRYGPRYDDARSARGYGARRRGGWDDDGEELDDDEWAPPGKGGRSGPRTPPRGGRGRRG